MIDCNHYIWIEKMQISHQELSKRLCDAEEVSTEEFGSFSIHIINTDKGKEALVEGVSGECASIAL
jgi:hypothetical protein